VNANLIRIREQRARLIERSAGQRASITEDIAGLATPIAVVDRGLAAVQFVRERPLLLALAGAALVVLQPKRALGRIRTVVTLWQSWRMLRARLG
jgi:hypothetical protein